jgi:hypothetical protein
MDSVVCFCLAIIPFEVWQFIFFLNVKILENESPFLQKNLKIIVN